MRFTYKNTINIFLQKIAFENFIELHSETLGNLIESIKTAIILLEIKVNCIILKNKNCSPLVKDLVPRLITILKIRQVNILVNIIDLIGRIADKGAELVNTRNLEFSL